MPTWHVDDLYIFEKVRFRMDMVMINDVNVTTFMLQWRRGVKMINDVQMPRDQSSLGTLSLLGPTTSSPPFFKVL